MKVSLVACVAEFLGMTLFVFFGCGSAMGIAGSGSSGGSATEGGAKAGEGETTSKIPGWVLMVSLVFGLSITVLAYSIGHLSGGHLNCAVTFGLVLAGHCEWLQGLCNFVSQMLGSVLGAAILCAVFPVDNDMTHSLGANSIGPEWQWWNALIGELMGTFLLVTVVLQTACSPKSEFTRRQACLAIGLSVFVAHTVLIPIDGCSINPTRSFGPALVSLARPAPSQAALAKEEAVSAVDVAVVVATTLAPSTDDGVAGPWRHMYIFWIGPLLGAALAAVCYKLIFMLPGDEDESTKEDDQAKLKQKDSEPKGLGANEIEDARQTGTGLV